MKKALWIAALAIIVGTTAIVATSASASKGNDNNPRGFGLHRSPEQMEAMMNVIISGDYDAWKALVEESGHLGILEMITEDNFDQFVDMHRMMQDNDREGVREITEELGLRGPRMSQEEREIMQEMIASGDYDAWKALVKESGQTQILDTINEDNFDRFVEMHNLMESGDQEGAREIREELGLKGPRGSQEFRGCKSGHFG